MENRYYRHYLDYDTAIRIDRASGDSSPWADGALSISFRLDTVEGFDPSYQTVVWLEDASGAYLRSLLVSEYLAFGGYIHEEICPRWNGAVDWANESRTVFDAVTAATPRREAGEVTIDCTAEKLSPGVYYYCIQTHIVEEYNILWRGMITIGGEEVSSDADASWSPQRHDRAGDILRDVSAKYTPFPR